MASANTFLPEDLHAYTLAHTSAPDELTADLVARTRELLPEQAGMQICPEQATLLGMLTRFGRVRDAVEVGTFTGLSSLAVARALPADGTLLCLDVSSRYTDVAREFWERAGVAGKVTLRLAPAAQTLAELPEEPRFDLAFIDADKVNYQAYWDLLLPRMRTDGLIVVDNVLWSGRVLDAGAADPDTAALREFNERVAADPRVESVMLLFADGLTVARKR